MKLRKIKILSLTIGLSILTQFLLVNPEVTKASNIRLAGSDRYQTAVAISQKGWESSDYAVLVRGDDFADALCAGPLASKYNAPILFTDKYSLNKYTLEEMERLEVENVIIIGGYGVISGYIDQKLDSAGIYNIERIYGSDRYATAVEIAKRLGSSEIAITNAAQYTDALSISAIAAAKGFSILLTSSETLPDVVAKHLVNYRIQRTYLIGGTNVISKGIEKQVRAPVRLAGNDRYETNIKILERFAADLDFNKIFTASGEGKDSYADSLAGVVLAAQTASPIVLSGKKLPEVTKTFIDKKVKISSKIVVLGGTQVIPYSLVNELDESINNVGKSVFNQRGTYGPDEGTTTISGNLVISTSGVIVQNTTIEGDLLLDAGIGNGIVELNNVTVKGRTTIRGGGSDSIIGTDFNSKIVVIDSPYARNTAFRLKGKSKVEEVRVETNTILDASEADSNVFKDVIIQEGEEIILKGDFTTVSTRAIGVEIRLQSATLKTLNFFAKGYINGDGTVATANIKSNGVIISFHPTVSIIEKGYGAYIGGQWLEEGTTKYTPPPPLKIVPVPISNLTGTPGNSQASFTFLAPTGATSVVLKQSTNGTTWTPSTTAILTSSSTSATATGLINGQNYYFKLAVVGGTRAGDSNTIQAVPSNPIDDLEAVEGDEQVSFTFSSPTGATSVILKQSVDNGLTWADSITDSTLDAESDSALVSGLTNDQKYIFKLIIVGGSRTGDSNSVTATPKVPI